MKKVQSSCVILFILTLFVFYYCNNKKKVRSYNENVSTSLNNNVSERITEQKLLYLKWKTPEGWTQKNGSGIRLATFLIKSNKDSVTCTIVALNGDGGGLRPNIKRWLGQLKINMNSEEELNRYISKQKKFKTSGNIPALFIDFTTLTSKKSDTSMFVTILNLEDKTIFIKLKENKFVLNKNRDKFISLCKSLETIQ